MVVIHGGHPWFIHHLWWYLFTHLTITITIHHGSSPSPSAFMATIHHVARHGLDHPPSLFMATITINDMEAHL
jgi:hypothetical protein